MIFDRRKIAPDGGTMDAVVDQELGLLPGWDLSDLYNGADDPAVEQDMVNAQTAAEAFAKRYRGTLGDLNPRELLTAIQTLEDIYNRLGKVISFAQLSTATDKLDPQLAGFEQNMMERYAGITGELVFFDLEFAALDAVSYTHLTLPTTPYV